MKESIIVRLIIYRHHIHFLLMSTGSRVFSNPGDLIVNMLDIPHLEYQLFESYTSRSALQEPDKYIFIVIRYFKILIDGTIKLFVKYI
jgi:hypothetical protein